MTINQLMLRSLKKNMSNYYLYVFALVFSVALYFAFVTLQYDPALDEAKGSIKGGAAIRTASVLLVVIVSIFLLYANNIFIKRRSKEIGMLQLIGMTKNRIFRMIGTENFILYYSSIAIGIFFGFIASKLVMMILFKITKVEIAATLNFSTQALTQTVIVFTVIFVFILLLNYLFMKKQSILSLFRVLSSTQVKVKKMSILEIFIGILGFGLIGTGYYVSSKLFGGDLFSMNELFLAMLFILASVILGTYFFYKGSVSFALNILRKQKNGYLNIKEVLSLSSLMFRMKSNALLLTIITTVSALAIGLLCLSYIAYYSAEKTAENYVAADFALTNVDDAQILTQKLNEAGIDHQEKVIDVIQVEANIEGIMQNKLEELNTIPAKMQIPLVSEKELENFELDENELIFTGYSDLLQKIMPLGQSGEIQLVGKSEQLTFDFVGQKKDYVISNYFTVGGLPTAIVDEKVFNQIVADLNPDIQKEFSQYIGITLSNQNHLEKANAIFGELEPTGNASSRLDVSNDQKKNMGLMLFIVGFLGLTFLITSGCILYFKQMDESEEETGSYTILRKLGFTQDDLIKGIRVKQLFNFGIPLIIGLLHGYFAVQSGWFLFGSELWTPMFVVMALYAVLYSIFGVLSVLYYKKVIRMAL
ncbi:ABC transporter permease [Aquibacillus koreensis]|uniref:ABC transporter permease n=1 Tax=Aquibacillus koreensis TaxID=279446 RepID=A0A9X3WKH5_9BACI|nr:ABC transporter permease [Aquibacillus koreensis]MCT2537056.1 ABC transporter permease [Aquibacillus koreensis]MDC3419961.1 ABC transporter permease [Aquibacillus koreensis]